LPWNQVQHSWQIAELVEKGQRLPVEPDWPIAAIIQQGWAGDPAARPTFKQIYNDLISVKNKALGTDDLETKILKSFAGQVFFLHLLSLFFSFLPR
jgi:hypothetical protein